MPTVPAGEQIRLRAAAMFAEGLSPPRVAVRLRVSRKSAYAWWRAVDLTSQHRHLVSQDEELDIFRGVSADPDSISPRALRVRA
ncbi:helix-turn-helix domain-containing protein [Frankia sp. Mgl5]|nr:helix-turn-helix domain-containing protein [Frankia sp. Mgl5]